MEMARALACELQLQLACRDNACQLIELVRGRVLSTNMAHPARIKRCIMIEGGLCNKTPWVVTENTVDGLEMITLCKSDSGFSRFVSGSNKGIMKMQFIDQLRKMRTSATIDACNDSLFDGQNMAAAKHFKARKDQWRNNGSVPTIVEIMLPPAGDFRATLVKVQASLDVRSNVSIELSVNVLNHIAACMRGSEDEGPKRQRLGNGVRWSAQRKCYIATRPSKRMRLFRADAEASDADLADDAAKQDAFAWAAKSDSDESDGDGQHGADGNGHYGTDGDA